MAEEAFALSPISARGSLPSETDYVAIREAFLETARGRWFLSEFSKRNRTADTNEVLDAVARIEATIAATRDSAATLIGAMSGIRAAVRAAKVSAAEAMPRPGADDQFVDARQSIQTISKVTMTMRECGADPRICNLLDSELKVIAASQQVESITESRKSVLAAFDVLIQRIEGLALRDDSVAGGRTDVHAAREDTPTTPVATPVQAVVSVAEKPASSVTPLFPAAAEIALEIEASTPIADTQAVDAWDAAALEPDDVDADIASTEFLVSEAIELETALTDAMAADDLAMLDLVAAEMGVPEAAIETLATAPTQAIVTTAISAPPAIAPSALPAAAVAAVAASVSMQAQFAKAASVFKAEMKPKPDAASLPRQQIPAQPSYALPDDVFGELPSDSSAFSAGESLGAALLANGVITHRSQPPADPLAAIRRMSQNEKIAFFS